VVEDELDRNILLHKARVMARNSASESNVVDTGVPAASVLSPRGLPGGPCFTTAQAGMQFNRHIQMLV